ncbi:hypothetical protein B0T22DRAFT_177936 [Podospora appendiculata]|uniref:DDE-1 domain-containing protein n=1 Tax=Podospora appendiculata TaxID=314037 RepID=A0AAE1CDU8_9PEZI|nr:hypothetical protein B0T22DRAFT_177936 [Podospora appendiculata]
MRWLKGIYLPGTRLENNREWRLLILDEHSSHTPASFMYECFKNKVQTCHEERKKDLCTSCRLCWARPVHEITWAIVPVWPSAGRASWCGARVCRQPWAWWVTCALAGAAVTLPPPSGKRRAPSLLYKTPKSRYGRELNALVLSHWPVNVAQIAVPAYFSLPQPRRRSPGLGLFSRCGLIVVWVVGVLNLLRMGLFPFCQPFRRSLGLWVLVEFGNLVGGVLCHRGQVPLRIRVPALPLDLVLQLAVVRPGGDDSLHLPLLFSVDNLTRWILRFLAG